MGIAVFGIRQGRAAVQRLAEQIHQSAQAVGGHRDLQRRPEIVDRHAALQARSTVESDGADMAFVEVLVDLEQIDFMIDPAVQGLPERRQRLAGDHHHRAVNFGNGADDRGLLRLGRHAASLQPVSTGVSVRTPHSVHEPS
jgi:hypothetical protein